MALTAQYLGWTPDIFWAATPQECNAALTDPHAAEFDGGAPPITRSDVKNLLELENNG